MKQCRRAMKQCRDALFSFVGNMFQQLFEILTFLLKLNSIARGAKENGIVASNQILNSIHYVLRFALIYVALFLHIRNSLSHALEKLAGSLAWSGIYSD